MPYEASHNQELAVSCVKSINWTYQQVSTVSTDQIPNKGPKKEIMEREEDKNKSICEKIKDIVLRVGKARLCCKIKGCEKRG